MAFDRFIVTHIDKANNRGYVRQLSASPGDLIHEPIQFDLAGVTDIIMCPPTENAPAEIGYSIPALATRQRQVTIGTTLVGSVARSSEYLARGTDNFLFLRNWGFTDQFDALGQVAHVS